MTPQLRRLSATPAGGPAEDLTHRLSRPRGRYRRGGQRCQIGVRPACAN